MKYERNTMEKVAFNYSKASKFISEEEIKNFESTVETAKQTLVNKTGAGNDFLGWIDLPVNYDKEEFARIKAAAKKIQEDSDVLLVIGIGGSYLGARAAIEFLGHSFYNNLDKEQRKTPEIYYVGNSISSTYISHLIDVVKDKDFSINMISKSGTTTEPAIAFRVFKEILVNKYGKEEAAKRIYATTDKEKGSLKHLANEEGYESFVTTDDHLMHITGIAKDQNGNKYYITKNSWGTARNNNGGYLNMSDSYVRAKTIYIMVHKNAIPSSLKKKLGL